MNLRIASSCAFGVVAALAVASASPAGAQQRDTTVRDSVRAATPTAPGATSTRRIRVGKERSGTSLGRRSTAADTAAAAPVMPAPVDTTTRTDTVAAPAPAPAPVDTTTRPDTTTVVAPAPVDTTTVTATVAEVSTPPVVTGRFGNGFYVGLAGGTSLPQGYFNDWYQSGWNVSVPFGWQRPNSIFGVRGDISYNRLSGRERNFTNFGTGSTADPQIWAGMLDLKLNIPLSPASTWRPTIYALGGGGVHYFKNFTSDFNTSAGVGTGTAFQAQLDGSSQTKFGLNGGAGFSFGIGAADIFIESRYVTVFTRGNNVNYVPVNIGITFF